jgi:hypothetical protein
MPTTGVVAATDVAGPRKGMREHHVLQQSEELDCRKRFDPGSKRGLLLNQPDPKSAPNEQANQT